MSEAKKTAKHSPLPWRHDGVTISDARDREVAETWGNQPSKLAIPDAALIVEAVNNYEQVKADRDALLLALKMQQERHKSNWDTNESCYVCDVTRAAISQVERHKKGGE